MRAAPAPFLLDREQVGILADQMMARHHAAGEEMLRDPVLAIGAVKQIGAGPVSEDVHEEASAVRLQPRAHPDQQVAPVHHMLEHLDRDDAVEPLLDIEPVHVAGDDAQIF